MRLQAFSEEYISLSFSRFYLVYKLMSLFRRFVIVQIAILRLNLLFVLKVNLIKLNEQVNISYF